jgi:hypothetical protein
LFSFITYLHLKAAVRRLRPHLSIPDYSGLTGELILGNEGRVGINSRQGKTRSTTHLRKINSACPADAPAA